MKKKVLLVCFNADKKNSGYAMRVFANISALADSGYSVSVIRLVPLFHRAESWKKELKIAGAHRISELGVLPIARYWFLRAVSAFLSSLAVSYFKLRWHIDVTIAEGHEAAASVLIIKFGKTIVDFHGAVAEELQYPEAKISATKSSLINSINWIEKKALLEADHIFVVSELMIDHLASKWGDNFVRNVDLMPISWRMPTISNTPAFAELADFLKNKLVFCYSGGAQDYQCIKETLLIFRKIHAVNDSAVLMIFSPDLGTISEIVAHIFGSGVSFIRLLSLASSDVCHYLTLCHLGFVLRNNNIINRVSCPTKINEYLSAGLLLLCTASAGHGPVAIRETRAGVVIPMRPDEIDAVKLLGEIDALSLNYDRKRVEKYLEKFGSKENAERLSAVIENI